MSLSMKAARWQLAIDLADDDGIDILDFPGPVTERYLDAAQNYLSAGASSEEINVLAARFRSEE